MTLLFLYLFLAIGVSFLCSILEAVMLSVNHSYIALLESKGRKEGRLLRKLKENIDKPLATILSLNTIAHTVGAAGVGAQSLGIWGSGYLALTSGILTFLILIFSEIIPKTLGAKHWRKLAPVSARLLIVLNTLLLPIVWFCGKITSLVSSKKIPVSFSREELSAVADFSAKEGVLNSKESIILKNLILFRTFTVKDIMTPRVVVESFSQHTIIKDVHLQVANSSFSRLLLFNKHSEDISGYFIKNDLLLKMANGEKEESLEVLKRDILVIPVTLRLFELMDKLRSRHEHIAAVVDEYGGFCGIVTLEDLMETLLGLEIMDEVDTIEDMQQLARQQWVQRKNKLNERVRKR